MVASSRLLELRTSEAENQEAQKRDGGARSRLKGGEPLQPISVPPSDKRRQVSMRRPACGGPLEDCWCYTYREGRFS